MFTLAASPAEVKAAFLPFVSPLPVADRTRLEADYAAYGEWLDANADSLAADYEAEEAVESGHWAW